jgi:diguanylate cyclase (GGDEF)-like protein
VPTACRRLGRRALKSELLRRLSEAQRYAEPLSIILLDIDRFKDVNDHFGHDIGDHVLRTLVERLGRQLRASDVLGRWGGEEFVIVAPRTDAVPASELAERCRRALEAEPFPTAGTVTASFGVAARIDGGDPDDLLRRADDALYAAKRAGRNHVVIADAGRDEVAG